MKTKIYCKTVAKGKQAFYLTAENKDYYLFSQDYRVSVREYFISGISVKDASDFSGAHSTAVRRTLEKLKAYIPYIEKEYGIAVMEKTKRKNATKRRVAYKRKSFNWRALSEEEMLYGCIV